VTAKRTYGDQCGIARALDAVGERWSLLVVRELTLGPKRFTDLRRGLPNVGPDVLSQRLRDLEAARILRRRTLEPPAAARVYELTERGRALEPVLIELGRWGSGSPLVGDAVFSPDSLIFALRTLFDPAVAGKLSTSVELKFGDDRFTLRLAEGSMDVARGSDDGATVRIEADAHTLADLLWQERDLDAAMAAGEARIEGSKRAARRFLAAFPVSASV
jgi:DNA-binding HxlR family transcriptional regulator/putative sterol carrier protein